MSNFWLSLGLFRLLCIYDNKFFWFGDRYGWYLLAGREQFKIIEHTTNKYFYYLYFDSSLIIRKFLSIITMKKVYDWDIKVPFYLADTK
jgi:hypothetical protein